MNLAHFPFDTQMCTVEIESFGYTMSDLKYAWQDGESSLQLISTCWPPSADQLPISGSHVGAVRNALCRPRVRGKARLLTP